MISRWWRGKTANDEVPSEEEGLTGHRTDDTLLFMSKRSTNRFSIELYGKDVSVTNAGDGAELDIDGRRIRLSSNSYKLENGMKAPSDEDVFGMLYDHDVGEHAKQGWLAVKDHTELNRITNEVGEPLEYLSWMYAMAQKGSERVVSMRMNCAALNGQNFIILRGDLHGDIREERMEDMADYLETCMKTLRRGRSMKIL
jgi:hypothetical protein